MEPILFLKGVHVDECKSIEDIFTDGLISNIKNEQPIPIQQIFDRLPSKFFNLDSWPKQTNLVCWWCSNSFNNQPVFIPQYFPPNIEKNGIPVYGNFCSFNCATSFVSIDPLFKNREWEGHEMLRILYRIFNQKIIKTIIPAPYPIMMMRYGGTMTESEYKALIKDLDDAYLRDIEHSSVKSVS